MKYDFSSNDAVKALVERRHPEFQELKTHWTFLESCYEGGRKWLAKEAGNVFKFYKEGEDEYKDRLKRTYRANHTKRVVDTVGDYLFKQLPQRAAGAPSVLTDFWANCDKLGTSMDAFTRVLDRQESVFGRVYIAVDRPAQVAARRAEEKLPYVYIIKPTHMLDMGFDEDGKMTWALVAEDYRDDIDPVQATGKILVRLRLWTKDEWYLFGPVSPKEPDKFEWLGAERGYGLHGLGEVPIVIHSINDGTLYSNPALIGDIAYMDRTLVNYGSLLDEIIYEQTYSQLVLPAESILPGTTEFGQMVAAAKNRVFIYNGAHGSAPSFISPDASQAQLIIEAMNNMMRNIYAVTGTDNDANSQSMSTGKSYASGTVRAFDHAQIENMLLSKSRGLEKTEDAIMRLVLKWMGQRNVEIERDWVRYPSSFDVRGLAHDLEIARQIHEVKPPPVISREHMKAVVEKLFPRKSPAELTAIQKQIDAWTPAYEQEADLAEREVGVSEKQVDVAAEAAANLAKAAEQQPKQSPNGKPGQQPPGP